MSGLAGGRSHLVATPLIAIATFASLWALGVMIELGAWQARTALALGLVVVVIVTVRMISRSRILPTIAGAAAIAVVMVPFYAKDAEGNGFALPTPAAYSALLRTLREGAEYADTTTAPAVVAPALAALLTVGLLGFFLVAEHLAVSWRAVASAGLLLVLPWLPAVVLQHRVSPAALVVALAAWILAMAMARTRVPTERGVSMPSAAVATTSALLLMALVAPTALGGNGWGAIPRLNTPELFEGGATRLNLELDLRNSLTVNSNTPVFAYTTVGRRPDAFRLYSFTDFNGTSWDRADVEPTKRQADGGLLWTEPVPDWATSERETLFLNMSFLVETNLPIPTAPRTVNINGPWYYDSATDEIVGDGVNTLNASYSVVVDYGFLDPAQLRRSDAAALLGDAVDVTDPKFFEVAPAIDLPGILSLTRSVTQGTTNRYDAALAIQQYLRNPSVFTYDTTVDPASGDLVSNFLRDKHGFCVHFATTMVVMLRSIGIPARMGLGFLPGRYTGDGNYVVNGGDAHAWAEVYFPGYGWVRFEPTPAVQSGSPPDWADPFVGQIPVPRDVLEGGELPTTPRQVDTDEPGNSGGTPVDEVSAPGLPWWVIAVLVLVALGAAAGGLVWWRRRGGLGGRLYHGPEAAWHRLRERLGDVAWPLSATPLEAAAHVLRSLRLGGGQVPSRDPESAMTSLSTAVSDSRYSPWGTEVSEAQLHAWVDDIVAAVEASDPDATARRSRGASRSGLRGAP